MMIVSSIHLFLWVISLALGHAIPIHNYPKEYNNHESFYDTEITAPNPQEVFVGPQKPSAIFKEYALSASETTVSSPELTASSLQLAAAKANKEPASARKSPVGYQQSIRNSQRSPVHVQKFTSSLTEGNNGPKGLQKSSHSSIANFQVSTITSLPNPDSYNTFTSGSILQRVKRQQRWRRKQSSHNIHAGRVTKFCNNFGCNRKPAKHSGSSRCPSGTSFDRKSNQCRRVLRV